MNRYLSAGALLSPDEKYRYSLYRLWNADAEPLVWVMLNPSTADSVEDDATIHQCVAIARHHGYGGIRVVNLFALRARDPAALLQRTDPVGPDNDSAIRSEAEGRDVVCAWGASVPREYVDRPDAVLSLLGRIAANVGHIGLTKSGDPRHPLWAKRDVAIQSFARAL